MIYTNWDAPDLQPSRLCLGTMNFGPKADEKESHTVLDCSPDLGINFADTADIYRYRKALGTGAVWTEEIIGPRTCSQLEASLRALDLTAR